jgi:streptomycin 6-kinase
VFGCVTAGGEEVAVKLTATPAEARAEAAALTSWAGTGVAVPLIAADPEHGALLLRRIRPGTPLPGGGQEAAGAAAGVLRRLHPARPSGFPFPDLRETYLGFERRARDDARYEQQASGDPARGEAGLRQLGAARAAALELCTTTGRAVLLHGDFLGKNLLWNGTGYLAIDPIPCLGDPCADAGFFAAGQPPAAGIFPRAGALAARLGLDRPRTLRWAAIWAVLQACQAWRPDQAELEAVLSSGAFGQLIRD